MILIVNSLMASERRIELGSIVILVLRGDLNKTRFRAQSFPATILTSTVT